MTNDKRIAEKRLGRNFWLTPIISTVCLNQVGVELQNRRRHSCCVSCQEATVVSEGLHGSIQPITGKTLPVTVGFIKQAIHCSCNLATLSWMMTPACPPECVGRQQTLGLTSLRILFIVIYREDTTTIKRPYSW